MMHILYLVVPAHVATACCSGGFEQQLQTMLLYKTVTAASCPCFCPLLGETILTDSGHNDTVDRQNVAEGHTFVSVVLARTNASCNTSTYKQ